MRFALALAAALALCAAPAAASAAPEDAVTKTDLRCLFVSGALAQSDDQELKSIGTLSLFYFWGRLEGRGATADIAPRLIELSKSMTADEVKAEAHTCADMSKAAGLALSNVSDALSKALGPAPAPPQGAPPPGK